MSRHTPAHDLWAAYRSAPCRRTRDGLAVHYRPLVRSVAHRTAQRLPDHVDAADLVQSGVFGLLEAIDRFDPDRCARFESYAVPRIRGAVLDELRAQDWVPRTIRLRVREAERVREQLAMHLRRTASEREVADALGMPLRELRSNTAARAYPEYDRPGRFAATNPEDDEVFLRQVRERAEEQRRQYREKQRREQENGEA